MGNSEYKRRKRKKYSALYFKKKKKVKNTNFPGKIKIPRIAKKRKNCEDNKK